MILFVTVFIGESNVCACYAGTVGIGNKYGKSVKRVKVPAVGNAVKLSSVLREGIAPVLIIRVVIPFGSRDNTCLAYVSSLASVMIVLAVCSSV